MRPLLVALVLLTSSLALPSAAAKSFAEDGTGDTQTRVFGGPSLPVASPASEAADLVSMELLEDAEKFTFTLGVAAMPAQSSFSEYAIRFTWAKDEYVVYAYRQVAEPLLSEETNAWIVNEDSEDRWDTIAELDHVVDAASGTFTIDLPKAYLADDRGRYPLLGDELKDLYVEGYSYLAFFGFTTEAYDRMPDGEDTLKYPIAFGDLARGNLRLDADDRVRVSNGGATTFVYKVRVQNTAEADDEVKLELSDMPEGWNGTVQSPLRVPGGSERSIAILVSVPFAHDHGGFSAFNVTARSDRNPDSIATVRLGVLHTPIPQPAGHHAELYLHAQNFNSGLFGDLFPFTTASMNTESKHDGDAPEAAARGRGDGVSWRIPLDPVLRMGLDFDVEKTGEIVGSIVGHTVATGKLSAELVLTRATSDDDDGGDEVLLAESDAVDISLDVSNAAPFRLTLTPTFEADYVPYAKGQNMVLLLRFEEAGDGLGTICCIPGTTPGLVTQDFVMKLPLNEYHDKLNGLAETADTIELKAEGAVEKVGLPGTTMTYIFSLVNHAAEPIAVDLDVAGTDAGLGTLVPGGTVHLGAKESRKVTLAVGVPTGRNEGEELEVLVFAYARDDPSISAIARTKTVVGKTGMSEVVADESEILTAARQAEENDTPAPGALLVLAGIAAAAFAMRRRT